MGTGDAETDHLIEAYRKSRPGASPSDIFFAIGSDKIMRMPAITQSERKAALGKASTYMYLFQRKEALMGGKLGASHGAEMPFVFPACRRKRQSSRHRPRPP